MAERRTRAQTPAPSTPERNPAPQTPERAVAKPETPERTTGRRETRRVRFLVSVGGLHYSYTPGEIYELPAAEAAKWADGERAEYAD